MELRAKRAALLALALALTAALLAAPAALGQTTLQLPHSQVKPPPFHRHSARQVIAIADRVGKVRDERRKRGALQPYAYTKGPSQWQVSYFQGG